MAHDLQVVVAIFVPLALACAIGWTVYARRLAARRTAPAPAQAKSAGNGASAGCEANASLPAGAAPSPVRELADAILSGQRRALSRGITLVESGHSRDRTSAAELVQAVYADAGGALRIGISGPPGVGKSTFAEAIGLHAIALGKRVAVLAVDPSSTISGAPFLATRRGWSTSAALTAPTSGQALRAGCTAGLRAACANRLRFARQPASTLY